MGPEGLMVSVSGIRGRVGAGLTPEVVTTYASAFGAWATAADSSKPVVVGQGQPCVRPDVSSRASLPRFSRSALASSTLASPPRRPVSSPSSTTMRPVGS